MENREAVVIRDVRDPDEELARIYRQNLGDLAEAPAFAATRGWLAVPLETHDRIIGMLTVASMEPAYFTPQRERLVRGIANQTAAAIENAQLFEESKERTRELTTMLDVARNVASTLELDPLLQLVLEQVHYVAPHDRAGLLIREGDSLRVAASIRPSGESEPITRPGMTFELSDTSLIWEQLAGGEPVIIGDIHDDTPMAVAYRDILGATGERALALIRSWMASPILFEGRVIAVIVLSKAEAGFFTPRHAELTAAIGTQAGVAIENARLFAETEARTRELTTLLDVGRNVASTLELQPLLDLILEQVQSVVPYDRSGMMIREGDELVSVAMLARPGLEMLAAQRGIRVPVSEAGLVWGLIVQGKPAIIDDIRDDSALAREYRERNAPVIKLAYERVGSFMAVPIMLNDEAIGMMMFTRAETHAYGQRHAELATALGTQAAVAIKNARLFEETQRRGREMEALFRADEQLFQSLSLDAVFQALVDVCVDVLGVPKSIVTTVDAADGRYTVRASRNMAPSSLEVMLKIRDEDPSRVLDGISEPMISNDARASASPKMLPVLVSEGIYTTVDVPIKLTGTLRGVLGAGYTSKRMIAADELRLLQALAERAAIAIDNAELYERAQQVASLEERQKLARELHDSVSQALYGIALGARTARTLLDRDPAKAIEPVDYVLSLAEAGLTEMRALIFELRPESLEMEGLVVAIEKNVAATQARYGIEVTADLCVEPKAPLDVKEAAYRIAQEALHNIVKHAQATRVDIRLTTEDGALTLVVQDNGVGFDSGGAFPGHIGLRSMRERTAKTNGTIEITSAPGAGTCITARLRI